MRRTNHWPTTVRLATDNALCPSARVSVIHTAIDTNVVAALIAHTTAPSAASTVVSTTRLPSLSIAYPIPNAPPAPRIVAQKLSCA